MAKGHLYNDFFFSAGQYFILASDSFSQRWGRQAPWDFYHDRVSKKYRAKEREREWGLRESRRKWVIADGVISSFKVKIRQNQHRDRVGKFQMRSFWKKATFTIILERCNMSPHLLTLIQPTSPPKSTSRQPRERRCETLPRLWRISSGQSSTSPNTLREVTCRCSLCWKPRARRRESHTKTLEWFTNLSLSLYFLSCASHFVSISTLTVAG